MVLGNLSTMTHGATMVYPSEAFEPEIAIKVGFVPLIVLFPLGVFLFSSPLTFPHACHHCLGVCVYVYVRVRVCVCVCACACVRVHVRVHVRVRGVGCVYYVGYSVGVWAFAPRCDVCPADHCFGMVMGNLAAMTSGATMVYPCPAFDPEATIQVAAKERCTALYGVPTMFIAMLAVCGCTDCDGMTRVMGWVWGTTSSLLCSCFGGLWWGSGLG